MPGATETETRGALVELNCVSKRFMVRVEKQRSFQQTFIRLAQARSGDAKREFWPLRDISFSVVQGESFGIIGPNGSGKSTILKLISRILQPTSGRVVARGRVASLLELGAGFHPDLTGRENIFLNASVYGLKRAQVLRQLDEIIDFAGIEDFIDMPVRHYSSGMYVRLGFAVAIHTEPDILLVDEVLSVGDAAFQTKCLESVEAFRSRGGTLLLVTHDLNIAQAFCNRVLWLENSRVQAVGLPTDVVMAYLSHAAEGQEDAGRLPLADCSQRWGTGKVRITRVELCDADGVAHSGFVSGTPMQVRLSYRADKGVEDPLFGLAIHHANGTHICGPNSGLGGLRIGAAEGEGVITYSIPALSLLEGSYLLSVSSHNRTDTEMYDFHDRAYLFRVRRGSSPDGYGLVTLHGEWRLATPNGTGRS